MICQYSKDRYYSTRYMHLQWSLEIVPFPGFYGSLTLSQNYRTCFCHSFIGKRMSSVAHLTLMLYQHQTTFLVHSRDSIRPERLRDVLLVRIWKPRSDLLRVSVECLWLP